MKLRSPPRRTRRRRTGSAFAAAGRFKAHGPARESAPIVKARMRGARAFRPATGLVPQQALEGLRARSADTVPCRTPGRDAACTSRTWLAPNAGWFGPASSGPLTDIRLSLTLGSKRTSARQTDIVCAACRVDEACTYANCMPRHQDTIIETDSRSLGRYDYELRRVLNRRDRRRSQRKAHRPRMEPDCRSLRQA